MRLDLFLFVFTFIILSVTYVLRFFFPLKAFHPAVGCHRVLTDKETSYCTILFYVHAKLLLSCLALWDTINCSLPVSSIHGILQARILEWVAIPVPGDLPYLGTEPRSPALEADSLLSEPQSGGISGKEPTCQCSRQRRHRFNPWVGKIPLEEGMATHSSILAWRIPWTEEPGGL